MLTPSGQSLPQVGLALGAPGLAPSAGIRAVTLLPMAAAKLSISGQSDCEPILAEWPWEPQAASQSLGLALSGRTVT
jgi:hypothetical protein